MVRQVKRNVGKERFWRRLMALLRRLRRSQPMTVRDFCAEHDVSEPSFYAWRRIIAERDHRAQVKRRAATPRRHPEEQQPSFVPLTVLPATVNGNMAILELVLRSGLVVRVPPGFDAGTLRQLLSVLEEKPSC